MSLEYEPEETFLQEPVPATAESLRPPKTTARDPKEFYTLAQFYREIGLLAGPHNLDEVEVRVAGSGGAPELSVCRIFDETGKSVFVLKVD